MPGGDAGRLTDGVDIGRNRAADRPCGDLRVLDMSIGVAGKYCTMLMAGFGADVIAIESPKRGDVPRGPEALRDTLDGPDALSAMLGRGKRRVTLDWSTRAGQRHWRSLCAMLGCPEHGEDPRFATARSRLEHAKEVDELLTRRLADRSRSELYHAGQARRLPLAPVNSIADLLVSPQLRARSFFYEPFDQDLRSGAIGPPFKFSETPWTAGGCSRQGEDTREIYGRLLGLDEAALDELAQCGVI